MTHTDDAHERLVDPERLYVESLSRFTKRLEQAIGTSKACSHQQTNLRRYWASVLFTRICSSGVSLLWLSPRSSVNPDGYHWDFGSIASLARNIFECCLSFYYLGIESVSKDESDARLNVMQIHDHVDRFRMLTQIDSNLCVPIDLDQQINEIRNKLNGNPYFVSLPESKRKKLLKGEQFCILTQDEILQRMGLDDQRTRGYYRFLSSHTHSFPLAFYRMAEHRRGHGVENKIDKVYIAGALDFLAQFLERAVSDMQAAFVDVASFKVEPFDWNALRRRPSPPEAQGFQELLQKVTPRWDIDCKERGCLMFTDIHRSIRERPADPDRPEYLTIAVGIERRTRRPSLFAFHVPPSADKEQGLTIRFLESLAVRFGEWGVEVDNSEPITLKFESCSEESFVARASAGRDEFEEIVTTLTTKFFDRSHVLLEYVDNNQAISTMMVLSPFREAYYTLCNTEFKSSCAESP